MPKEVRESFKIKEGDVMEIEARITTKEEVERQRQIKRFRSRGYGYEGNGVITRINHETKKQEEVIALDHVFAYKHEFWSGVEGPMQGYRDVAPKVAFSGIIISGRFLSTAFQQGHYRRGVDGVTGRYLFGDEQMILRLTDGKALALKNLSFDPPLNTTQSIGIEMVEFHAYP